MKKPGPGKRTAAAKSKAAPKTIDDYLSGGPEPARTTLEKVRALIRAAAPPEATEAVSYGMPAFRHNGVLVWFAAFSDHCSLFPTASVMEALKSDLKGYHLSKGTIQFPVDKPLPSVLIRKIVKLRVVQAAGKKRR